METNLKGNALSPQRLRPLLKAFDNSRINGRRPCLNTVDPTIREFDDESSPPAEDQDLVEENPGTNVRNCLKGTSQVGDYQRLSQQRPQFAPYNGIQDSLRFWIARRGFRIPGTGFQSQSVELGLWIRGVFRIPKPTIPDSRRKSSWISLLGATECNRALTVAVS